MIDLSLGEAEALAAKVARGSGFSWGIADDIGRAARMLAQSGEPWADALVALSRDADHLDAPSPERVARWRNGNADIEAARALCPVRTALLLIDAGLDGEKEPLRLKRVGLPIWLRALLLTALPNAGCRVDYAAEGALSQASDVTISSAKTPRAAPTGKRASIRPDRLEELLAIAARIYVPESERSRARGAGGGSVDGE